MGHARQIERRSCLLLLASALAGAVLVSPARASAALPDCFEVGFFSQACVYSEDAEFPDNNLCAFPLAVQVTGVTRFRPFFAGGDTAEPARATWRFRRHTTVTNEATGRFFTDHDDFTRWRVRLPNGSSIRRDTGLFHDARMDSGRRLLHQSGERLALLGPGDDVISEVFHGRFDSEAALPGKVCPLLARAF